MNKIHLLDKNTIEKIAAGEIIQNPRAIIKEAIENSIDAQSSAIVVEILDGGRKLIRVTDNGIGMEKDDLKIAFKKHATSKIFDWNDLYNISSCGFRGEALNAIGQVTNATIISSTGEDAFKINNNYGRVGEIRKTVANKGTTLLAEDIFQNSPIRKKFLPNPRYEESKIKNLLYQFAIGYPEIAFKLIINNREVLNTSGSGVRDTIFELYGTEIVSNLIYIDVNESTFNANIYIGKPSINKSNNSCQMLFINNRIITDNKINKALENAYANFLPSYKKPIYFIYIDIPKENIDVNVHPTKKYVSIQNLDIISTIIENRVLDALNKDTMVTTYDSSSINTKVDIEFLIEEELNENSKSAIDNILKYDNISVFENSEEYNIFNEASKDTDINNDIPSLIYEEEIPSCVFNEDKPTIDEIIIPKVDLNSIFGEDSWLNNRIVGSIFNKFIVIENRALEKIILISIKDAMERILYDEYSNDLSNDSVQTLLEPYIYKIDEDSMLEISSGLEKLNTLGFDIEILSKNSLILRGIPAILFEDFKTEDMYKLLEMIENKKIISGIDNLKKKIISIISHTKKDYNDMEYKNIIDKLFQLESPGISLSGKRLISILDKSELERLFNG